jgi:RNA polymerase sigma-70 factor (ECF subfamily)
MVELKVVAQEYGRMVSAVCKRIIREDDSAKEAAQEAWLLVLKNIGSFRGESSLSTWIYRIAWNCALKYRKKEARWTHDQLEEAYHVPAIEYPGDESGKGEWIESVCAKCIHGVLRLLNFENRLIFVFRLVVGLDFSVIAGITGSSLVAVRKSYSRSKKTIALFIKRECGHGSRGICLCGMHNHLQNPEYNRRKRSLDDFVNMARLLKINNGLFPDIDYWKNLYHSEPDVTR